MHAQIAHDLLDAEFGQIAVAAVQLQRLVSDVETAVGDEALGHGDQRGGVGVVAVERGGGLPQQRAGGFERGRHVGEAELQRLEFVEAFAERLALLHVSERHFKSLLRAAERAGGDVEPAAVEPGHGDLEACALRAEPVGDRHAHVLERDCARRLGVPAHLALAGAERNTGCVAGNDHGRNAGRAVAAGARHHRVKIAGAGAGDELFLAADRVMVAVAHRACRQRRRVGADARLGQAIAAQKLHGAKARQPLLALCFRAMGIDHPGHEIVDRYVGGDRRAAAGQRLEDQGRGQPRQPGAADVFGDIDAAHAERRGLAHFGDGKMPRLVPGHRVRREHFVGKAARHVAHGDLVLVEGELR